ncbi:MAG: tol-pal system protein YbgF [Rhodospirillales bacterium]
MRLISSTLLTSMFLAVLLWAGLPAQAQDAQALSQRLERLERDIQTLSKMVARGPDAVPASEVPAAAQPAPKLPKNAVARIGVRLDTLENELRDVTGRIEEMTYNLEQLTARVDRLVADVDFRLSGLEQQGRPVGQAPGNTAAVQLGGDTPQVTAAPGPSDVKIIGEPPRSLGQIDPNLVKSANSPAQQDTGKDASGAAVSSAPISAEPVSARKGAPSPAAVTRAQPQAASLPQTSQPQGPVLPDGTPQEQYQFAFGLLRKHQFDQAEMAFKEFLAKHEGDALSGNARYWLGETHYARAEYVKAAEVFLQGFEKDPKGGKAPDSLLKLAMSLGQLGQNKEGCAAIDKLFVDFPNANSSLKRTASRQQRQMNCKQ